MSSESPEYIEQERDHLINQLLIDIMANTDCPYHVAIAAISFWEWHYRYSTASVYGVVEYGEEKPNIAFDSGTAKRSLKVGVYIAQDSEPTWLLTIRA